MKLAEVVKEAERFIRLAKVKGVSGQRMRYDLEPPKLVPVTEYRPMDNSAIKRASLDLSRALTELRKTLVGEWRD